MGHDHRQNRLVANFKVRKFKIVATYERALLSYI